MILTDTDLKERKALELVWPNALMLLCMFHVCQSWKNKLNELLGSKGTSQIIHLRKEIKKYIKECVKKSQEVFQVFIFFIYIYLFKL